MTKKPLPHAKAPQPASLAEVEQAICDLSAADAERLERYAKLKAIALRAAGLPLDPQDLVQEAMNSTLAGATDPKEGRRWNKDIKFVVHLIGAIKSDASHALRTVKDVRFTSLDAPEEEQARAGSGIRRLPSRLPDPERVAASRDAVRRIQEHFKDDSLVLLVMDGLFEQMKGPEIQCALEITENQYESAMLRLRRNAPRED